MSNVDVIGLALRRHGVDQWPPVREGAYFTDNPKTEVWVLDDQLAAEIREKAAADEIDPGNVVQNGIRSYFRLPDFAGESPINIKDLQGGDTAMILDRDDDLTMILKAVARAKENTNHLRLFMECMDVYLHPSQEDEPSTS